MIISQRIVCLFAIFIWTCSCNIPPDEHYISKPIKIFTVPKVSDLIASQNHYLPMPINLIVKEYFIRNSYGNIRWLETGISGRQTIVLFHGATFDATLWNHLGTMRYFALRGYKVVSVDLPKHGKSTGITIPKANFVNYFLHTVHAEQPVLIGHSYAGSYLLPFLTSHSQNIASAVLIAPTSINENRSLLPGITTPTLILWGEKDEMISLQQGIFLNRILPNSQLHILKNARHECYLYNTTNFHQAISNFLRLHQQNETTTWLSRQPRAESRTASIPWRAPVFSTPRVHAAIPIGRPPVRAVFQKVTVETN